MLNFYKPKMAEFQLVRLQSTQIKMVKREVMSFNSNWLDYSSDYSCYLFDETESFNSNWFDYS